MRDDVKILIDNGSIFTACELCPWGCGMEVVIKDGKVTKIKGVKDHPLNRGMLCPKGKAAYAFVTHPDRIAYPMKKVDGKFVQISWDEAFDILKEKLIFIKEKYGAKSFAVAIGMPILLGGNATVSFLRRFWDIYGSPNCFSVESICFRCRIIGYILTFGKFPVADIDHSSCIVLWGNNPTNSNPPAAMRIIKRVKEGAKLIVIDPRRIPLAKKADIHLMIRPGSDCALALSMMNVLINENLYDKEFVDKWCVGFDELKKLVFKYPPEAVEKIAGVDKELIKEAARLFGSIKPACVVQGTNALDQHTTGLQNARAIASLMALTGNIDNKGGFVTTKRVHISPIRLPEKLEGLPLGINKFPLFYEVWGRVFGEGQAMVLANTILTQKPYPIKALFVAGSNPVLTWPETPKVKKALASLEFVAVMDLFLTDTAKYADLFLPAASFLERVELCDYYGTLHAIPYITLRKKVLKVGEAISDLNFWIKLARKMGYDQYFPWQNEEEAINFALEPTNLKIEDFKEHPKGMSYGSLRLDQYKQKGFATPSKKVELFSQTLLDMGYDPLPVHEENPENPFSSLYNELPLIMTTGARSLEYLHSGFRNIDKLKNRNPEPLLEIHPETAKSYGVKDGDMVIVENLQGKLKIKIKFSKDIKTGIVNIPHGWPDANVNLITKDFSADPITGYPALKASLCKIRKA